MVLKILFAEDAVADLESIHDYISTDNPAAAKRFVSGLLNHVGLLATLPHIGAPISNHSGVRKMLHTPVRVYYRILEGRRAVQILHFWHVSRQEPKFR